MRARTCKKRISWKAALSNSYAISRLAVINFTRNNCFENVPNPNILMGRMPPHVQPSAILTESLEIILISIFQANKPLTTMNSELRKNLVSYAG